MKYSHKLRLKRSVSAVLAASMAMSVFSTVPVYAETGTTTYNYDGYKVDYTVTNEWFGNQSVNITLTNTGDESILNWALGYDANGEINGIWNGYIYSQTDKDYIIKNSGYNYEIEPYQSVNFGYTLSGYELEVPEKFELCSKRVDVTDGYDVQCNYIQSWDTGVQGELVITNTSTAPIEAWTLSFDTNFTINNLWNGRILENNETSYVVSSQMWTNPIQPNSSKTIGFVGTKAADVEALLNDFKLTAVVIGEGAVDPLEEKIEITANAEYIEESGNVTVSWITTNPSGTFDIFMSSDGENFISVGTVENVSEFVYTPATDFDAYHFKVVQTVGEQTVESNLVTVENSYNLVDEIIITAEALYDEENGNIIVSWISNNQDGTFDVLMSENGDDFVSVETVENVTEYVYTLDDYYELLYFKVAQTTGKQSATSNTLIVEVIDNAEPYVYVTADYDKDNGNITISWVSNVYNGYYEIFVSEDKEKFVSIGSTEGTSEYNYILKDNFEVSYFKVLLTKDSKTIESNITDAIININWDDTADTDNDGLTDVFEKHYYGTDFATADTDGDSLSDGYEVFYFGTNPAKFDSDDNGISDGDEDFDNDVLSNFHEYELGTDPFKADTDEDRVSDFDEINKYNTNPLKYDTDEDNISDGDEISLGLNPNIAVTDGIPDSEHTSKQHIDADSEIFADVNVDDNPFKVSIDITAAGIASNNLKAQESVFSNVMKNDAILGLCPEFIYTDGLKIDDVVINFDINNNAVSNKNGKYTSVSDEFVGIKRLNVFKYFEDTNMLLPIETFHDVENNRVYTHVDELGTYCLMDLEIWLESIGFEASEYSVASVSISDAKSNNASEEGINNVESEEKECLDIVLIAYPNNGILDLVKTELVKTCGMIFDEADNQGYSETRIYLVSFFGDPLQVSDDKLYVENIDEATAVINRIQSGVSANISSNSYMLTRAVNCVNDTLYKDFRSNSKKYCFIVDAISSPACEYEHYGIEKLKENGAKVYFECNSGNENYSKYLMLATDAVCGEIKIELGRYNFGDFIVENIFGNTAKRQIILTSSGLKVLPDYFEKVYNLTGQDFDNDGIADPNEINLELVTVNENGVINYPSFDEIEKEYEGLFYVEKGLERLKRDLDTTLHNYMQVIKVMPIKSDPTEPDGDFDSIPDNLDKVPLSESKIPTAFKDLIVNRVVKYDSVVRMSDNCYVCYEPLHKVVDSSVVTDYVLSNGNLTIDDRSLIENCLSEDSDDFGVLCLAGTFVGKDEMYFVAPVDATDVELSMLASSNADYHRHQIIESSELQNNIGYKLLKKYSENISAVVNEQDTKFNNALDFFYNSGEQMKLLGFYNEDSIVNIGSLKDSLRKSAWRFLYQLGCLVDEEHIKCSITTTTVSYIEYSYWYRQQYPNSSGFEQFKSYIGDNTSKSCDYIVLDINDRLMNGTPESRGEFLGELLFDIGLDVAIGKIAGDFINSKFASETLDDLDDIKTRKGAKPRVDTEPYSIVEVRLGNQKYNIKLRTANTQTFNDLVTKYGNEFIRIAVKYSESHLDDILILTREKGNYIINLLNTSGLSDDVIEQFLRNEKSFGSPWDLTNANRHKRNLPDYSPTDKYTSSFIKIDDDIIYGINSSVLSNEEKDLGRAVYAGMRKEGYLEGTRFYGDGKAQILTHAEGYAVMQAYHKYGDNLNKTIFIYCDRSTCHFCQKDLWQLKDYFGLENMVIINNNGGVIII